MSVNPSFSEIFSGDPFSPFDDFADIAPDRSGGFGLARPKDDVLGGDQTDGELEWGPQPASSSGGPDHDTQEFIRIEETGVGPTSSGTGAINEENDLVASGGDGRYSAGGQGNSGSFGPFAAKPEGTPGGGNGGGGNNGGDPEPTGPTDPWYTYVSGQADAVGTDNFNIQVEFYGLESDWLSPLLSGSDTANWYIDAFVAGADYLSSIITTGFATDSYPGAFFDGTTEVRSADDIVIEVYLEDIDGAGGILGQAGPTYARDADGDQIIDGMPTAGIMQFDIADAEILLTGGQIVPGVTIDGGVWFDTVLHEMMHVLGFGTLWGISEESSDFDWDLVGDTLTLDSDSGTRRPNDDEYHYDYLGSANSVAGETLGVEANGGSGTARGHWDELLYGNEIMTGYIDTDWDASVDSSTAIGVGSYNQMAAFTVAALADLGYTLDGSMTFQQLANLGNDVLMMDDVWGFTA